MRRTGGAVTFERSWKRLLALIAAVLLPVATTVVLSAGPAYAGTATLTSVSISPPAVDTASAAATVTFTVGLSAPDAITTVSINTQSPGGTQRHATEAGKVSGTPTAGQWRGSITLPVGTKPGWWIIGSIEVVAGGQHTLITTRMIRDAGFPKQFHVAGVEDSTPPALAGLTESRSAVDVTRTPQLVRFTLHVRDDRAGADRVAVTLAPDPNVILHSQPARLSAGTPLDGTWTVDIPVAAGAAPGTYSVAVLLTDTIGNVQRFDPAALASAGLPHAVTVATRPPAAPTGVTAHATGPGAAEVQWKLPAASAPAVSYYNVSADCPLGSSGTNTRGPTTEAFFLTSASETECTVTVRAVNGGGISPASASAHLTFDRALSGGVSQLPTPVVAPGMSLDPGDFPGTAIGTAANPTALPIIVDVNGLDTGGGVCSETLQRSTDGGAWASIPARVNYYPQDWLPTPRHRYQYRVRYGDCSGHLSGWGYGPHFGYNIAQETLTSRWSFAGNWRHVSCTCLGGGGEKTTERGGTATFVSGPITNLAVVLIGGVDVAIYVDGTLYSTQTGPQSPRQLVFDYYGHGPGRHVVQIVNLSGGNLTIDAIVAV